MEIQSFHQCTMWLSFSKNGIRDSTQISTTAPIFLQFNYFRQNLEENVTFTFNFFNFASNFPCKILRDNENIDANILNISDPIFAMLLAPEKKVILRFFSQHKKICLCAKFEVSPTPSTGFFANNCLVLDKYVMGIFFLQILSSFWPVSAGIIIFWSKLSKN